MMSKTSSQELYLPFYSIALLIYYIIKHLFCKYIPV
jgi:hypothetical protein